MKNKASKKAFSKLLTLLTAALIILFTIPVISACTDGAKTSQISVADSTQNITSESVEDAKTPYDKLGFALGLTVTAADMAVAVYLARKAVLVLK